MGNLSGQILGEIGEIGKSVGSEVVKLPGEIAGKALESLGTSGNQKSQGNQQVTRVAVGEGSHQPADTWEKIDSAGTSSEKQQLARAALSALLKRSQPKKKSVWEILQDEKADKDEQERIGKQAAAANSLPQTSKPKRGDLYGMKAKKASAEMSRNVRQD